MESPSTGSPSLSNSKTYCGTPGPQNSVSVKQPMSATLRERLRKSRRSFGSTCTVAKRLKIDCDEGETPEEAASTHPSPQKDNVTAELTCDSLSHGDTSVAEGKMSPQSQKQVTPNDTSLQHKLRERRAMVKTVEEKEEILRRLKMVKLYRSKNNLSELQSLIDKWRNSSQLLLYEIQTALSTENRKISLTELIESCGLDNKLLHYNTAEEDFDE